MLAERTTEAPPEELETLRNSLVTKDNQLEAIQNSSLTRPENLFLELSIALVKKEEYAKKVQDLEGRLAQSKEYRLRLEKNFEGRSGVLKIGKMLLSTAGSKQIQKFGNGLQELPGKVVSIGAKKDVASYQQAEQENWDLKPTKQHLRTAACEKDRMLDDALQELSVNIEPLAADQVVKSKSVEQELEDLESPKQDLPTTASGKDRKLGDALLELPVNVKSPAADEVFQSKSAEQELEDLKPRNQDLAAVASGKDHRLYDPWQGLSIDMESFSAENDVQSKSTERQIEDLKTRKQVLTPAAGVKDDQSFYSTWHGALQELPVRMESLTTEKNGGGQKLEIQNFSREKGGHIAALNGQLEAKGQELEVLMMTLTEKLQDGDAAVAPLTDEPSGESKQKTSYPGASQLETLPSAPSVPVDEYTIVCCHMGEELELDKFDGLPEENLRWKDRIIYRLKGRFEDGAAVTAYLYDNNPKLYQQLVEGKIQRCEVLTGSDYEDQISWLNRSLPNHSRKSITEKRRELFAAFFGKFEKK